MTSPAVQDMRMPNPSPRSENSAYQIEEGTELKTFKVGLTCMLCLYKFWNILLFILIFWRKKTCCKFPDPKFVNTGFAKSVGHVRHVWRISKMYDDELLDRQTKCPANHICRPFSVLNDWRKSKISNKEPYLRQTKWPTRGKKFSRTLLIVSW